MRQYLITEKRLAAYYENCKKWQKISMHTKKRVLNCYLSQSYYTVVNAGQFPYKWRANYKQQTVVLQKKDENTVGRSRNSRGGLTKSWNGAEDYESHKKETDGVLRTYYEERRARRCDADLTCKWEEK